MNQNKSWYIPLIVMFLTALFLSGCGASFKKPTGLTPLESEQEKQKQQDATDMTLYDDLEKKDASKEKIVEDKLAKEASSSTEKASPHRDEQKREKKSQPEKTEKPKQEKSKQPTEQTSQDEKIRTKNPSSVKPPERPVEKPVEEEKKADKIVYSIVISSSEVPLPATEMEIQEGDTVLQSLINITKSKKIQMDYRGGQGATAYVEGIDNVYEFDRGQGSGWMFRVNGIFPDRGAGAVTLMAGDRVEWLYTTNLGEDLNANLQPFRR